MSRVFRTVITGLCAFAVFLLSLPAFSQISCGGPPKADQHRRKAAESFPPLPLPATPLRRTEKKRPPAPPTLMAKVNYADKRLVSRDGSEIWGWTQASGDTKGLFQFARAQLGINYKAEELRAESFSWAPERVPVMFFSGREPVRLSDDEKANLRRYIELGGFVFGDANCGSEEFAETFRVEMQSLYPDRPWYRLPADHPLLSSHFTIDKVEVNIDGGRKQVSPVLEGLNVGFRTAILLTPYGIGCGWDDHTHSEGKLIMPADAKRLGVNLLAYVLAYYRVGRAQAVTTVFREAEPGTDEVVIAQLRHNGDWDPDPSGLSFLLRAAREDTTADVKFRRVPVDPENADLFAFPFLYLTGQLDFAFTKPARENLRAYLERGGFLFIVNASHRVDFDRAVRHEMKAIFPDNDLAPLAAEHPLFKAHNDIPVTPILKEGRGAKPHFSLRIEGIDISGGTAVVYAPLGLGAAWQDAELPFTPMPERNYALALGVNAIVYAITH